MTPSDLLTEFIVGIVLIALGILVDVFLPERWRIRLLFWKKRASMWLKNPAFSVGITSRLDLKQPVPIHLVQDRLHEAFSQHAPTMKGTELHFKAGQGLQSHTDVRIQLDYEDEANGTDLLVFAAHVTVSSKSRYKEVRSQIEDIRATLEESEKILIKSLDLFPVRKTLYVEVESLEQFAEMLENFKADQLTGTIRGTDAKFVYHDNRLTIEDGINSQTIAWFKNVIAYVG